MLPLDRLVNEMENDNVQLVGTIFRNHLQATNIHTHENEFDPLPGNYEPMANVPDLEDVNQVVTEQEDITPNENVNPEALEDANQYEQLNEEVPEMVYVVEQEEVLDNNVMVENANPNIMEDINQNEQLNEGEPEMVEVIQQQELVVMNADVAVPDESNKENANTSTESAEFIGFGKSGSGWRMENDFSGNYMFTESVITFFSEYSSPININQ